MGFWPDRIALNSELKSSTDFQSPHQPYNLKPKERREEQATPLPSHPSIQQNAEGAYVWVGRRKRLAPSRIRSQLEKWPGLWQSNFQDWDATVWLPQVSCIPAGKYIPVSPAKGFKKICIHTNMWLQSTETKAANIPLSPDTTPITCPWLYFLLYWYQQFFFF